MFKMFKISFSSAIFSFLFRWQVMCLLVIIVTWVFPIERIHSQEKSIMTLVVKAGDYDRLNSPVSISLEGLGVRITSDDHRLFDVENDVKVPIQMQADRLTWILSGPTLAGSQRTFELQQREDPNEAVSLSTISARKQNGAISFEQSGRKILRYQFVKEEAPSGASDLYERGGFIHPLWSPRGEVLSRIQPPDHFHHYGIWNPWTSTTFEGRDIDFWNLAQGQGTVKVVARPIAVSGPVFGEFSARHAHVDLTAPHPSGAKEVLDEEWVVTVWSNGSPDDVRLIDFHSTLYCATDSLFKINAYRYQGFSFRATEKWDDQTARLLTSEGKDKSDGNGTRARWCDIRGVSSTGQSGILFMSHPLNYNFPEQVRIWPTGMNGGVENVFFNFNPAQEQDWILHPGKAYSQRYRMLVYDGQLSPEQLEIHWQDYAHPPSVEILIN